MKSEESYNSIIRRPMCWQSERQMTNEIFISFIYKCESEFVAIQ